MGRRTRRAPVAAGFPRARAAAAAATTPGTVVAALAMALLLLVAAPAAAHDQLVSVTPADGSTVTSPPEQVVLEFSDVVQPLGTGVVVRGADGRAVGHGATHVDGTTVTQALDPLAADGTYYVSYRVVSADGHPVSGTTTFVADGLGPEMSPTASLASGVRTDSGAGTPSGMWALAVLVGVALVVIAVLGARRRAAL